MLTAPEFFQAARWFPIAFSRAGESGPLVAVAITSFLPGQNRFVDEAGEWEPGVYIPAYVRRYPFHTVSVERGGTEPDFLLCVDESGLDANAPALFDAKGRPSREWGEMEQLIRDMEVSRRQTQRLLDTLDELELVDTFEAQGLETQGRAMRLGNLFRVNEDRLNALPGRTVKALMALGALPRIYAHLWSLDNFAFLLDREAR